MTVVFRDGTGAVPYDDIVIDDIVIFVGATPRIKTLRGSACGRPLIIMTLIFREETWQ
jgi:hypothetical protein